MVKIIISEKGKEELNRLCLDIENILHQILELIPKVDLIGLNHIYVTDLPENLKKRSANSLGAYYKKQNNQPAFIELYLKKLFAHIRTSDSMNQMLPIQTRGLAATLFHEVGHHIEHTRSHGIKKNQKESFASGYAKNLLNPYLIRNAEAIGKCFDDLESLAESKGLSLEVIRNMKAGWEREYKQALNSAERK